MFRFILIFSILNLRSASDKPDLGLEELSMLNVKSRFQVFEKQPLEKCADKSPICVKRSPSILSKLAKYVDSVIFEDRHTHISYSLDRLPRVQATTIKLVISLGRYNQHLPSEYQNIVPTYSLQSNTYFLPTECRETTPYRAF